MTRLFGAAQLGIQVKRSELPLRFPRTAWSRMEAEVVRLGWAWVVAAVGRDGSVRILDPRRAKLTGEPRLADDAVVENLLLKEKQWLTLRSNVDTFRDADTWRVNNDLCGYEGIQGTCHSLR